MNTPALPQSQLARAFPTKWYDPAPDDHFWMVWRLNVILRHLRRLGLEQNIDVRGSILVAVMGRCSGNCIPRIPGGSTVAT
jgi:hypothetical protein